MKLSMSLISKFLRRYPMECDIRDDNMMIRGVRFLSDPRLFLSPEYVYIGKADTYFSDRKYRDTCMIVNGHSRIFCYECDYEELLNDLMASFDFYNEWEKELWVLGSQHAPMQAIMDKAFEIVDAPAFVSDLEGNILALSKCDAVVRFPGLENVVHNRKLPASFLSHRFLDIHGNVISDIDVIPRRYYLENRDKRENSAVCAYLTQDAERVAFAQIFDNRDSGDFFYIQTLAFLMEFFQQADEISGGASGIRSNASIMSRLLLGETLSEQAIMKFRNITAMQSPWQLLILNNLTIQNYTQRSLVVRGLNSAQLRCFALEYEGTVLVLIEVGSYAAMLRELRIQMNLKHVAIGVSMPIQALTDLPMAYRQAKFALSYQKGPGVYACRDYALQYLMSNLRGQDMVTELLHPAIAALEQYDRENQTQLLQTLRVYLQEDRNQVETARRLHTHRNTVKYRLERIDQLTGIDFSDWQEQVYLNLSLLLEAGQGQ